ncbi:MAG: hypothetical protein LBJ61_07485 [Deltaproteobacteria bacterium]|jgi:type IV pilus assembly protein PilY1|nr:hypothetical protein [Deltaproteobacteria bacterium]
MATLLAAILAFCPVVPASAVVTNPLPEQYQSEPFATSGSTVPTVLLSVAGTEKRMYEQAYPGLSDLDGDGRPDTGFHPATEYVGYFDSSSCYEYVGSENSGFNEEFAVGDKDGYFRRVGAAVEDEPEGSVSKPSSVKDYVPAPSSPFGVCYNPSTGQRAGSGQSFSGNWLNYIATARIDAVRKLLYGGRRKVDTLDATVLEHTPLPHDIHVWATEIRSDDTWMAVTPLSAYYDARKYTPYAKPASGKAHFVVRASDFGKTNRYFAALRILTDADKNSFQKTNGTPAVITTSPVQPTTPEWYSYLQGRDRFNCPSRIMLSFPTRYQWTCPTFAVTEPYASVHDWATGDWPQPNDSKLTQEARGRVKVFNLNVRVCVKGNIGETEGCLKFPGPTEAESDDTYKPSGLLHRYSTGASKMQFGLMTAAGGYTYGITDKFPPGYLRSQIGPFYGPAPANPNPDPGTAYVPAINQSTGQVIANGLVSNLDRLTLAGRHLGVDPLLNGYDENYLSARYYENDVSIGNPLGGLLYEAVRFLSGVASPTVSVSEAKSPFQGDWYEDKAVDDSPMRYLTKAFRQAGTWLKGRPDPDLTKEACANPVILLISDIASYEDAFYKASRDMYMLNHYTPLVQRPRLEGINLPQLPQIFNAAAEANYLDAISNIEGFASSGLKYPYAVRPGDTCKPKSLSSLSQVEGMCPQYPEVLSTYLGAAVAYYAHIHDFNLSDQEGRSKSGVDIFSVAMSSPFPVLRMPIMDSSGDLTKAIELYPTTISTSVLSKAYDDYPKTIGFLGYRLLEWEIDKNGHPFHFKIQAFFTDYDDTSGYGEDNDIDAAVYYEVDLLTDASTPASDRGPKARIDSGPFRTGDYYVFKNPESANSIADFISISPSSVKGLRVHTYWEGEPTTKNQSLFMGYTISGSTLDQTYLDVTMRAPNSKLSFTSVHMTPPDCHNPTTDSNCGTVARWNWNSVNYKHGEVKEQYRSFDIAGGADVGQLPSLIWLISKYGGFDDNDGDGIPDPGEWENENGDPKNYFHTSNLTQLADRLDKAFTAIARSVSTGTAGSASVSSILGGGVSVHTAYYRQYVNPNNENDKISWPGTVFGLFVDKWGNLREDSNGDHKLTLATGSQTGDRAVRFGSVTNQPAEEDKPDCFLPGVAITRCEDEFGTNDLEPVSLAQQPASVHKLRPIWDAGRWLAELKPEELIKGPRPLEAVATKAVGRRRIYYTDPVTGGLALFHLTSIESLKKYLIHDNWREHMAVPSGITLPVNEQAARDKVTELLIGYVQGLEVAGWRSREVGNPWDNYPVDSGYSPRIVWRLGDVINSKPIVVGAPSSNYDTIYHVPSYLDYRKAYGRRRQVAYFGANDGMLHAVNVGFYGDLGSGVVGYGDESPDAEVKKHELGAELWAYVPASVLPHLKWLADPNYSHSYQVDMKPLIADVIIDGQWRTVLIGGLRLGGRPIENPDPSATEPFYSEIFCLDVTDPESPPKFLWRYSAADLGLSVGLPTVVSSDGTFYVVIPSGPKTDDFSGNNVVYGSKTPYEGYSTQKASLTVLKLSNGNVETILSVAEPNSFFNDPFLPMSKDLDPRDGKWTDQTLYYGLTVSRDAASCDSGAVYRLRMVDSETYAPISPNQWSLDRFVSTGRPVTGAVNATYDRLGNLWVLFATGRLWSRDDLAPCTANPTPVCSENHEQYLYGIKEELTDTGRLKFSDRTPLVGSLVDLSGVTVYSDNTFVEAPGENSNPSPQSYVALADAILQPTVLGYKRRLDMGRILRPGESHAFEISFTQPKILGMGGGRSLVAFTTFEPKVGGSSCGPLGNSYMYILDAFTGLAHPGFASLFMPDNASSVFLVSGGMATGTEIDSEVTIFVGEEHIAFSTDSADYSHWSKELDKGDASINAVISWREALNTGFEMTPESMTLELDELP